MWDSLLHMFLHLLDMVLEIGTSLIAALGMRWLLNISTPEKDMQAWADMWRYINLMVSLPDPWDGVNLAYLSRMRERMSYGGYSDDMRSDETESTTIVESDPPHENGVSDEH